jgi:capsular polysaccharide biosynthesis protein
MEIRRYLSIIRRRLPLVIAIIGAALAAGYLITPRTDTYTAQSTLYVGSRSFDLDPASGDVSGDRVTGLDRLITTFKALVTSRPVAEIAAERADLATAEVPSVDDITAATTAQQLPETNLILVTYSHPQPHVAAAMANAVAGALVQQIRDFEPRRTRSDTEQVISRYDEARLPTQAEPSHLPRNLILSGALGVVVAGALLALLEYLDVTLRSREDAELQLGLPVLGVVPKARRGPRVTQATVVPRQAAAGARPGTPAG